MRLQIDRYKKVAGWAAAGAGFAFIGEMDEFSIGDAGRNGDTYRFLISVGTPNGKGPHRPAVGFFKRNADSGFHVTPASCESSPTPAGALACGPENTLEEVAEITGSVEISELHSNISTPIGRRFEIRSRLPVLPECVILFSFLRIGKDAVGLI